MAADHFDTMPGQAAQMMSPPAVPGEVDQEEQVLQARKGGSAKLGLAGLGHGRPLAGSGGGVLNRKGSGSSGAGAGDPGLGTAGA